MNVPKEPGYYWAKLKTPSGGMLYHPSCPEGIWLEPETNDDGTCSWASLEWEIVEVWENGGDDEDEYFGVFVHGLPITQWVPDFFWGPKIELEPPK